MTTIQLATKPAAGTPEISPYIASVESFHPFIQHELIRRSKGSEMADVYMPFIKLTSLSNVLGDNLSTGQPCDVGAAWCPSLGIHGQPEVSFEDIYNPTGANRSIIGYATTLSPDGVAQQSPVYVTATDAENDPTNIPMPGITKMSAERTTAGSMGVRGGLFKATIDIKAYSTGQVNALLRYFLRPATRVVLELGHQRANNREATLSANGIIYQKFNWNRKLDEINAELEPLVTLRENQRYFIEKYIYGNFGNYEIFIGYVVDFKLKFTKENVYEIQLIVHSLQQFEVPTNGTGVQALNQGSAITDKCKAIEITDYFDPPAGWRINSFAQLMAAATSAQPTKPIETKPLNGTNWNQHIIPLRGAGSAPGSGGNTHPGYLVSWEFFVNVILNDLDYGILSVFNLPKDSDTISVLRSAVLRRIGNESTLAREPVVSLNSGEVSWDKDLRSVNPDVMVIYNKNATGGADISSETAIQIASRLERLGLVSEDDAQSIIDGFGAGSLVKNSIQTSPIGSFDEVKVNEKGTGTSFLTKGVWINTNAIINAFSGADTVSTAINRLLIEMNNATMGLWNLQVLSNDTENPGMHVVDMGLSKPVPTEKLPLLTNETILNNDILESADEVNSIAADINKLGTFQENKWTPKYIYVFNRGLRTLGEHDTGGELLDITLESSLPQVIAVQAIAGVGGQMQRGALEAIDINELRRITLYNSVYPPCTQASDGPCKEIEREAITPPSGMPQSIANEIKRLVERGNATEAQSITDLLGKQIEDYVGTCPDLPENPDRAAEARRRECERLNEQQQEQANQYVGALQAAARESYESTRPGYLDLVSQYGARFGSVLDLISYDKSALQKRFDENSTKQQVHPFNSSNLTKTTVDLTTPGIGGIQLFQSFGVARVPNILDRGYYVATRVNHEFGDSGWITKIQGRFRYNPNLTSTASATDGCNAISGTCSEPAS